MARRAVATSEDFLLSGRSLPAWVTGIAFISANLGAIEILGMAASGAQYGISIGPYYWIGAVPPRPFPGVRRVPGPRRGGQRGPVRDLDRALLLDRRRPRDDLPRRRDDAVLLRLEGAQ